MNTTTTATNVYDIVTRIMGEAEDADDVRAQFVDMLTTAIETTRAMCATSIMCTRDTTIDDDTRNAYGDAHDIVLDVAYIVDNMRHARTQEAA
jgi:hypothetical protein